MATPCHILVANNPAIIYISRGGEPKKILPVLKKFLAKFWQERDISGEESDTPECLVAQLTARFAYETAEDDFSNLKVGVKYFPAAAYLYDIGSDRKVTVWEPGSAYKQDPQLGLKGCTPWQSAESSSVVSS
ncbi:MAG TPA: histidine kinase [Leptolyngbyaceae cyanobacterium M33_DOE_097]|uniref:Histidine kinase n=1 Tax=Oscillatoriales cyanobacterium SpSt-418 TaxID=2282169 RepID=A0A7C3KGW1_9CYAN|nr:histidine kinase [Leptolyngbyaceae cyanobacterium M33_DOE_097]